MTRVYSYQGHKILSFEWPKKGIKIEYPPAISGCNKLQPLCCTHYREPFSSCIFDDLYDFQIQDAEKVLEHCDPEVRAVADCFMSSARSVAYLIDCYDYTFDHVAQMVCDLSPDVMLEYHSYDSEIRDAIQTLSKEAFEDGWVRRAECFG